jgi:hypothetical protein
MMEWKNLSRLPRIFAIVVSWLGCATAIAQSVPPQYTPSTYAGTGPYRRVYGVTEYSFMSASVYLPSVPAISLTGSDTPYIYTGGWGTNGDTAVDAGFQYSPTYNDWSLFLSVSGGQDLSSNLPRFEAGQTVFLQFGATPTTGNTATLQINATGINIDGTSVEQTLTETGVADWGAGSDTLKRMTSIAQNVQNLSDGSFIDGVDWSNSTIGLSASTEVPWLAAETGGYQSYTTSVVSVNYVNAGNETDSISLAQAVPEPGMGLMMISGLMIWACKRRGQLRACAIQV